MKMNNRELAVVVAALDIYVDQMESNGKAHPVGSGNTVYQGGRPVMTFEQVTALRDSYNERLQARLSGTVTQS